MKRILILSILVSISLIQQGLSFIDRGATATASRKTFAGNSKPEASASTDTIRDVNFIKVYIRKIHNSLSEECSINGLELSAGKALKLQRALLIPFVSIGSYLKEYSSRAAYVPEEALKIQTPYGPYLLWASESGVMYAQDPQSRKGSLDSLKSDSWKAKKLIGISCTEHGDKKLYIASLVLKAIKGKSKEKLKLFMEPFKEQALR